MTASGSSTSDRAVGDRVTAGRVTPERAVAVSAIRLMQGVVYRSPTPGTTWCATRAPCVTTSPSWDSRW